MAAEESDLARAALFRTLGFRWDRSAVPDVVPVHSVERACFRFHKLLAGFVWEAGVLDGNPLTFTEVLTILDGITVGGRRIADHQRLVSLVEGSRHLVARVKAGGFSLSKAVFGHLNAITADRDALEPGVFRGEGQETSLTPAVALGAQGRHTPLPTVPSAPELNRIFRKGVAALEQCAPFERATAFFLFGALQQFFFGGNRRTSRLMMNGVLMANGIDALSVPAARAREFNAKMARFYLSKDATEVMTFLVGCHPDRPGSTNHPAG